MARLGMTSRIFSLILLIIGLIVGGTFWFDFLGLIDARSIMGPVVNPVLGLFGQKPAPTINVDDPVLLDSIRVRQQEEALDLRYQDYQNKIDDVSKQDQTVQQKAADLAEREKAQDDREKSFNDQQKRYDDIHKNLVQNSQYLTNMKPVDAVKILTAYDDQDLIDVLRTTQELADAAGQFSMVSTWLAAMANTDPKRVAEIQRKMTIKPPASP